ncbi:MAG: hypothetical protein QE271_06890 [Bacteriovoracaceae bacterium]|nr:hypothetical protein [Bacteriovoracaceae bacterium]
MHAYFIGLLTIFLFVKSASAQSVADALKPENFDVTLAKDALFTENVITIGATRRIYILTNENKKIIPGDYLTMISLEGKMLARGIVVKLRDDKFGIRVKKIYDPVEWNKVKEDDDVQLLKGDDSLYTKMQNEQSKVEEDIKGTPGDQLNSDFQLLSGDYDIDLKSQGKYDDTRNLGVINSPNILTVGIGRINAIGTDLSNKNYLNYQFSFMHQIFKNIWPEVTYSYSLLKKFPAVDIDSGLHIVTGKIRVAFDLGFYTYLLPYAGIKKGFADSPGAGDNPDAVAANNELALLDDVEQVEAVYGVSIIKRLVPSWVFRFDAGNDILAIGLGVEF